MSRGIDTSGKISMSEEQLTARQGGKLLFTAYHGQKCALLIRDDRLRAARLFPREPSRIGAVYIAKVKNAVRNLNAYFVEIGAKDREICFLSEKEASHPFLLNRAYDGRILEGDEFPVQVIRDASRTKQASVTTLISLANEYFALSVGEARIGYSQKLDAEQRERLNALLRNETWQIPHAPAGLVVRTRAGELAGNKALPELKELSRQWEELFRAAEHRTCFSCLLEAPAPWEAALEQLVYPYEYEEILTDDSALYGELIASKSVPGDKNIRLYDEKQSAELSLTKLYGLESKLEAALGRRVWLKSGGYLVIDQTEALTVIDVNSGKYESGKAAEETYWHINREAAEEIALQLRLRSLGGMIVVDFINMRSRERQGELLEHLRARVKDDKQKTVVVDMTPLGLVEITRKKSSKPLAEQLEAYKKPIGSGLLA